MERIQRHHRTPATGGARTAARGFTAVELLVVVFIVATLASIAMPSFADFTVNQRMRTAVYDLITDLNYARGEAVKRNASVTITRVGASWSTGWRVNDGAGNVLREHPALHATVAESTGPTTVTFGLDGHKVGSSSATFTFDDTTAKASVPVRRVTLDPSGRPRAS